MMRPESTNWRDEGSTVGRVAFDGTVHNWAMRNSGVNAAVLNDRAVVDGIITAECPDVRAATLQALQIDNLADGLAGF
ncbi:hypothetical protein HLB23_12760 [Nocardia uniformis]|uniref:Uncharacterized protein n=1 Tax=Nocardia uniformis TaxID=53432 RepID=A0A849C329_9NOCA|nr:hypothetical protein [Nocardia uniformis]NNH70725.1 hypothetical protein [Nocardia uniformis]